jgi:hypothetical protein
MSASVKSLVWYSPQDFKQNGYKVPTTLDELYALSNQIAGKNKKPWCAGISSGEATGWPVTDWMEDFMLRLSGPEEYDKWVKHEIPFNDPSVKTALDEVGSFVKNDKYVNGGLGDVKSIATTTFQDAGLPILQGGCSLHRQASFYAANWPQGTTVAEDGQIFAFFLPGKTATDKPVLGAGEFVTAFADRPEVKAALDEVGSYVKNDKYVNGGLGDVKSIATTTFQDAGQPILQGGCSMYRMASFYAANWGTAKVAEDGDVFAFYLPGKDANAKPVLGAGEFVTAFADRPEVKAFLTYMSSDTWANIKSKLGGTVVSANKGLKVSECKCSKIDELALQVLQDPNSVFRFDGSDLMPAAVGSNSFWKQITSWVTGQSTQQTLDNIEASWPK